MSLPENQKHTLMKIAGARLGGSTFMAVYGIMTVYREAKTKGRIMTPLANGRTLMPSEVQPLIDGGFVELKSDGGKVVLAQTDKRP